MNTTMNANLKKMVVFVVVSVIAIGLFLLAKMSAGRDSSQQVGYKKVEITMERTVCFGTCPSYKLSINERGEITYEGEKFVEVTGVRTAQIHKDEVEKLVDKFFETGFFEMKDEYTGNVTDLPTTITSINIDGRRKTVKNYYGAPEALMELESEIDRTANAYVWIGD